MERNKVCPPIPCDGQVMKRFFELTFRPLFVITGIGTALAALNAFWPSRSVKKVVLIPFIQDYTIIVQHWGVHSWSGGDFHDHCRLLGKLAETNLALDRS